MGWLVAALLVLIFTGHWFVSALLVGIYFYRRFRSAPAAEQSLSGTPPSSRPVPGSSQEVADLLLLRLELKRLRAAGEIDRAFYDQAIEHIDTLSTEILARWELAPPNERWRQRREAAWELLVRRGLLSSGPPPWQDAEHADLSHPPFVAPPRATAAVPPLSAESVALLKQAVSTRPYASVAESLDQSPQSPVTLAPASQTASPTPIEPRPQPATPVPVTKETEDYGWEPTEPSTLERALQAVSGWPALLAPLLVQNIGWFIGGLCFVAGSVLLVSYTTGFAKALAVASVLFAYTIGILWAGYQLRCRRSELETSSSVLLTLGALLVPLNVAAAVRLVVTSPHALGITIGTLTTAGVLGGLYFATVLVSGVMDRSLQGRHPRLFFSLAAVQLAVPLLARFPFWPLLASLHFLLLSLLAYGLVLFTRDWLRSIFVERRKTAYYAVGTLVYAATVSFVHLTWGQGQLPTLPAGYYSPFLMTLCGLLFYVDAQLKHWATHHVFLSRFSFILYGLSILALLLSLHTPTARLITLLLAICLYGMVVWQYHTLVPLYLLLGCVSWLYGLLVLQHLPDQWYLFASLPGLTGLFAASRWLQRRLLSALALVCHRVWMGAAFALTGWSLLHAQPGFAGMGTAVVMMGLAYYGLQLAPAQLFGDTADAGGAIDLRNGPWLYSVTLMGSVAVAYAPRWTGSDWITQYAFGLALLSLLWTALGLALHRKAPGTASAPTEVLLNTALLNLGLCLLLAGILAAPDLTHNRALPFLLAVMGSPLLWLSLALRERRLFYGALGVWGATGVSLKLTYFPAPNACTIEMLLALAVWTVLWWVERGSEEVQRLRREQVVLQAAQVPPFTLLWRFPVSGTQTRAAMLCMPLQQLMVLLWVIGIGQLGGRLLEGILGRSWALSAGLGALGALLAAGRFRQPALLPPAMLLGLGAWLTTVFELGVSTVGGLAFAGSLYSLFVWKLSVSASAHPLTVRIAKILRLIPVRFSKRLLLNRRSPFDRACPELVEGLRANGETSGSTPAPFELSPVEVRTGSGLVESRNDTSSSCALADACVHWTAFAITLLCISSSLAHYGLFTPSATVLLTLMTSMGFIWLAGQRYQQPLHSYTSLGIGIVGALLGYTWAFRSYFSHYTVPLPTLLRDLGLGLLAALLSLLFWAIAQGLTLRVGEEDRADFARSLYRKPLRIVAVLLALFAASQQLSLAWNASFHAVASLSICVLFLASIGLLLANHALQYPTLTLAGLLLAVLAALWTQAAWFHPAAAFTLWPGGRVFTDQWLTLALLAVGLSYLAQRLRQSALGERLYAQPFHLAAVVTYGWALAGVLVLFVTEPSRIDYWLAGVFLTLTVSSFLLLGSSSWTGFPWLAGLTLMCAGLTFNGAWARTVFAQSSIDHFVLSRHSPVILTLANLFWANLALRAVPWWRRHGETWSARWGWETHNVVTPLLFWPAVLFLIYLTSLLVLAVFSLPTLSLAPSPTSRLPQVVIGSLLTASFFHLWWLRRTTREGHAIVTSLFCTFLALWLGSTTRLFHFPLFLALWSAALLSVHSLWEKKQWGDAASVSLRHVLSTWLAPSLLAAIAALLLISQVPLSEQLITLSVLITAAAILGWQRRQRGWLLVALAMFVVLLHSWPLLWVPSSHITLLFPWYALQLALLSWLLLWLCSRVTETRRDLINQALPGSDESVLYQFLSWTWPGVAALALLEWMLHGFSLFTALAATGYPHWVPGGGGVAAALLAAGLLLTLGIRQAWQSRQAGWVYGVLMFGGVIGLYIRLLLVGLAPASVWDTAVLMGATCAIFVLYRITRSEPLFPALMVLPLLTLFTVPLQLASPHAGVTLIAAGTLYLLSHRATDRPLALSLAFLAFNAAIYLWIPVWANHYRMFLIYIVPAALSVLLLLHFHRHELKPRVLNGTRLVTLSILYASATFDVFVRDELAIFAVALTLSLAGIVIGITLRTRAFLYSGTAFLVLNILGQLLMLFPEQMLGRAIILLTLGALITGGMIWFNLQREKLLQRLRIFRADLATWA